DESGKPCSRSTGGPEPWSCTCRRMPFTSIARPGRLMARLSHGRTRQHNSARIGPTEVGMRFAIIGAGMSGILAAIKLREAGYDDFALYEKAERLGGTWRE